MLCGSLSRVALWCAGAYLWGMSATAALAQAPALGAAPAIQDTIIQPGHRDFSRYATPSMCFQAVMLTTQVAERALWDTAAYAPERDTLPTVAADIAHRCGMRFSAATVAPAELPSLINLALAQHRDDEAHAAAERWIATTTDSAMRGWIMYNIVLSYLGARPRRTAAAAAMSQRLDALGPVAVLARLNAYNVLLNDAKQRFDTAEIRRDAIGGLTLAPLITDWQRANVEDLGLADGNAVGELFSVELYRSPQTAVDTVMRLVPRTGHRWPSDSGAARSFLSMLALPVGHPAPPLAAGHWYGPSHITAWPVPGHVALLFWLDNRDGGAEYSQYALFRRLHKTFGDSLTIVLMTKTHGYADFTPMPAAQEAERIRAYYLDYLKLPVTVGVLETPFTVLADGRHIEGAMPAHQVMAYGFGPVVADRKGYLLGYALQTEAMIDAYVRRALAP
jgi:hypothetical protein